MYLIGESMSNIYKVLLKFTNKKIISLRVLACMWTRARSLASHMALNTTRMIPKCKSMSNSWALLDMF